MRVTQKYLSLPFTAKEEVKRKLSKQLPCDLRHSFNCLVKIKPKLFEEFQSATPRACLQQEGTTVKDGQQIACRRKRRTRRRGRTGQRDSKKDGQIKTSLQGQRKTGDRWTIRNVADSPGFLAPIVSGMLV